MTRRHLVYRANTTYIAHQRPFKIQTILNQTILRIPWRRNSEKKIPVMKSRKPTLHEYCACEQTIPTFLFLDLSSPAEDTSAGTNIDNFKIVKHVNNLNSITQNGRVTFLSGLIKLWTKLTYTTRYCLCSCPLKTQPPTY